METTLTLGQFLLSLFGLLLGSSGLFAFIQWLITRKDNQKDKFKELLASLKELKADVQGVTEEVTTMKINIQTNVNELSDKIDRNNAIQSRIRILRANDEMRQDDHHSYEYFKQLHSDITEYESYCRNHPEFKNNEAASSIEYINAVYQDCMKKNNFLA